MIDSIVLLAIETLLMVQTGVGQLTGENAWDTNLGTHLGL